MKQSVLLLAFLGATTYLMLSDQILFAAQPNATTKPVTSSLPVIDCQLADDVAFSQNEVRIAKALAERGDWNSALTKFSDAYDAWPGNNDALYGMAQYYVLKGNLSVALRYYRLAIYSHAPSEYAVTPGDGYRENDSTRLMQFVIFLCQQGQVQEALLTFCHTVKLIQNGHFGVDTPILFPDYQTLDDTPSANELESMAYTIIALKNNSIEDISCALALHPDSPIPFYYAGNILTSVDKASAHKSFLQARDLARGLYQKQIDQGVLSTE